MKRLPLVALFGTLFLTTVAAFATKAPRFLNAFHINSSGQCTATVTDQLCGGGSANCISAAGLQLFQSRNAQLQCVTPLKTE